MNYRENANAPALYALIATHLGAAGARLAPWIPPADAKAAVLARGGGLDLVAGEELLALLEPPFGSSVASSVLVSNARILGRSDSGNQIVRYALPHEQIQGGRFAEGSLLGSDRYFAHVGHEVIGLNNDAFARPIAAFLDALEHVAPGQRAVPRRPLVVTDASDPIGALGAAAGIASSDPHAGILVRLVAEAHRRGWADTAFALDLVRRIVLLHRGWAWGRGSARDAWWSPLPSGDLGFILYRLFGAPVAQRITGGTQWLEFRTSNAPNVGASAASTALGLALFAVAGVGWVSVPRATVQAVEVAVTPREGATAFELFGFTRNGRSSLSVVAPDTCARLLGSLHLAEAKILLLRALFGASPAIETLFALPRTVLEERAAGLAGPVSLAAFD